MTQNFKGDAVELQMQAAGSLPFDLTLDALASFYAGAYEADDFLLMLYDAGRMPFSERVPRDLFVAFIRQAIPNFPFTGTFEAYLFIIRSIFGEASTVDFSVPAPGRIDMLVAVASSLEFGFQGRELQGDGTFITFDVVTSDDEELQFRGIPGIDSQPELEQLLSELIPLGVKADIDLEIFELSYFGAERSTGEIDSVIDHLGNQLVFIETGA